MKKITKILFAVVFILGIFSFINIGFAENIEGLGSFTSEKTTNGLNATGSNISENFKDIVWNIIDIVRYVFSGILLIFIVYAGAQMIMSKGINEEELSKSKRTFLYCLIGIFFINFPVTIYNLLFGEGKTNGDFFFNVSGLVDIINAVITFLEILIIGIAIFVIVLVGIRLITSRGKEETVTEAKNKILWVIIALIFVGFIEVWRDFLIGGNISGGNLNLEQGISIFTNIANLSLYLAGPVALFFLTLAGYYYITSTGEDEKAKKGKNIIINTIIGIIILLCAYVLLNDLSLLTINL